MKNTIFAAFISFLITVTPQLALSAEGSKEDAGDKGAPSPETEPGATGTPAAGTAAGASAAGSAIGGISLGTIAAVVA